MAKSKQVNHRPTIPQLTFMIINLKDKHYRIFAPDISGGLPAPRVGLPLSVDI